MMQSMARSVIWATAWGLLLVRSTEAQVVQLPTYHVFTTDSSALVPDRGAVILGGINRAVSTTRGTTGWNGPRSRVLMQGVHGQATQVRMTVLDHREWDAAILAQATTPQQVTTGEQAERITRELRQSSPTASTASLAAQARLRERLRMDAADRTARELIAQGDACQQKNQKAAARIFYRTAWRQSSGDIRAIAQARLNELTP